ncbi:MAG: GIY-YIG nuclease family protein [Patescibacteria group bacterium]|jgi:putative endonuclease
MTNGNYYVYIVASKSGTLYIGVTNNLDRIIDEHKQGINPGFTRKYGCNKLVYYERFSQIKEAINYEKVLKGWKRYKKEVLIRSMNPSWIDLNVEE